MKNCTFSVLVVFLFSFLSLNAQDITLIPDPAFEAVLQAQGLDNNPTAGQVFTADVQDLTSFIAQDAGIQDLSGIENFINLETLILNRNSIESIDLSMNTKLKELGLGFNNLNTIDLSLNPDLEFIDLAQNNLNAIDLSSNTKLKDFIAPVNDLVGIDLSNNTDLIFVFLSQNDFSNGIDISRLSNLERLILTNTRLTSLDVSSNNSLIGLAASQNPNLTCIQVTDLGVAMANITVTFDPQTNFSEDCPSDIIGSSETEITFNEGGQLIISDTNGGDSDDDFEISTSNGNLRITNFGNTVSSDVEGSLQIDESTIEIPLPVPANGIFFLGEGGNNIMKLSPDLNLSGLGQFLVLNDFDTQVETNGILQLAGLNVNNGSFDTNGATIVIAQGEAGFSNSILKGMGTINGQLSIYDGATMSPGTSPGIIETGDLTLNEGSTFDAEVNGQFPGTDHDQVKVTGSVILNNATINLMGGYANAPTNVIVLIDNDGDDAVTGIFADLSEGATVNFGEFSGTISYEGGDGNDVVLLGPIVEPSNLIITEVMYDPLGGDTGWEWVEIYNAGEEIVELDGFFFDDNTASSHSAPNIAPSVLESGQTAILYDSDEVSAEDFANVWGSELNLIAVTDWPTLGNGGDSIGIWDSPESYDGDNQTQANTIVQLMYDTGAPWPGNISGTSIYLTNLESNSNDGNNWASSVAGQQDAFNSSEPRNEVGSPGIFSNQVGDTEAPMITCLDAVVMPTDQGVCEASFPISDPTATDNVSDSGTIIFEGIREDGLELTDPFPIRNTIITWTATDEAGNTSEGCEQLITINDEEGPEIICSPDIAIIGSNSEVVTIELPTVTDNCTAEPTVTFERSDNSALTLEDEFPQGVTTITWTAVDENDNTAMCAQTVTISMPLSMENDMALFNIPDQAIGTNINLSEKKVRIQMPPGTDLSNLTPSRITVSEGATVSPMAEVPQDFTEPVIYTVTAADGSTQEWTVEVTIVEDGVPPVFEDCEESIVLSADQGQCLAAVTFNFPTATDDVDDPSLIFIEGSFNGSNSLPNSLPVGESTIIWTAKDRSGNVSECIQTFTVEDNEDPIALCQDITVQLNSDGVAEIAVSDLDGGSSDNCGIELVGISPSSFTEENIGDNEVTLTVVDGSENSSSCVANVTVLPFESSALSITSYTLINADTDLPIDIQLTEGAKIDINDLPTLHLDIRANTTEDVESVRFSLDGALSTARTESLMPFALYRDLPIGDYIGEDFFVGQYSVSAIPYSEDRLGGDMGEPFTVNFELIDSTPTLSVTSFTLINADTDEPIRDLVEGEVIDINTLPTNHLDIRVNTTDDVESVRISISGALLNERTESLPPYALYRDLPIGDYIGEEFVIGEYEVLAIPYAGNSLAGDIGTALALNFELVDGDPACATLIVSAEVTSPEFCGIADGSIVLDVMGAEEPVTFEWSHDSELTGSVAEFLVGGTYEVTVTDAKGCTVTIVNEVISPMGIIPTLEAFEPVLVSNPPFVLTGGFPEGGTYSGLGVVAGVFDPAIGIGTYEITYVYEDVNFCENSVVQTIEVKAESMSDIISFILVNADTEEDLFPITNGMQIDISSLPTQNLDIRAEAGSDTESVGFELSGTQSITRGESIPPYALFQDLPIGDYIGHAFDLGEYTLSGTPFSQNSLQGNAGETLTIDFEFVDSTPTLAVTGFTLINAETESELFELTEGLQITLDDIPSLFLDIRANTTDDVESVSLELSGQQTSGRTESLEPYALFRDLPIGDYIGNNFEFGTYTVTATPYSGNNLSGEIGTPLSITFEIVDDIELNALTISPNQATTLAKASFDQPTEIEQILIFDMSGRIIESYNPQYIKSGDDYILDVNFYQQGTYIVKMLDNKGVPYQKQMIIKR